MPVTINPASLDVLKKNLGLIPGTDLAVSNDVLENDPELTLDTPHTAYEAAANEHMKNLLGLGPSPLIQEQQALLDARDKAISEAQTAQNPDVKAESDQGLQDKITLAHAQPGGLDVEAAKTKAAADAQTQRMAQVQQLMSGGTGGNGTPGAPGSWKPSINAQGEVSFTQNQMPALQQRAYSQLGAAKQRTEDALGEAERLYPGITEAAAKADTGTEAPSWLNFITGGGGKYGSATDLAGAANDRLKYSLGIPTPFSKLGQDVSFGNIEQMAGQLPGVRGLSMITGLFKQHQANWGHETPVATVQRLLHMRGIMDDTLQGIATGQYGSDAGQSIDPWATPPTADELAGR